MPYELQVRKPIVELAPRELKHLSPNSSQCHFLYNRFPHLLASATLWIAAGDMFDDMARPARSCMDTIALVTGV